MAVILMPITCYIAVCSIHVLVIENECLQLRPGYCRHSLHRRELKEGGQINQYKEIEDTERYLLYVAI